MGYPLMLVTLGIFFRGTTLNFTPLSIAYDVLAQGFGILYSVFDGDRGEG